MARIEFHTDTTLDSPMLVEGLPGVGLVGKITADHLIDQFDMVHYGSAHCEGLPEVAVYQGGERSIQSPVRIYADADRDLLVLQSDVPVSPQSAPEFAACVSGWFANEDVMPICLSGLPEEKTGVPEMYGIGCGAGATSLEEHGIDPPEESGMISGPTGAILSEATKQGLDSIGLVVQANAQFPDPEAARILLTKGIGPIAGIEVETDRLVEQAERIAQAREKLAKRMQEAEDESSKAQPLRMYQ